MLKIQIAYDRHGRHIGVAARQFSEHSQCDQPVTCAMSYGRLVRELDSVGLIDAQAYDEYVRTGGGPLQSRLDAIDQRQGRKR